VPAPPYLFAVLMKEAYGLTPLADRKRNDSLPD